MSGPGTVSTVHLEGRILWRSGHGGTKLLWVSACEWQSGPNPGMKGQWLSVVYVLWSLFRRERGALG